MIPEIRKVFNEQFTADKYHSYLSYINKKVHDAVDFRIAETPIFIDRNFKNELLASGNAICAQITTPEFIDKSKSAIPLENKLPGENAHPNCLVLDFAIALEDNGNIAPKLIELQGFPSLFAFEILQDEALRKNFTIPAQFSCYLNDYTPSSYIKHLKQIVCGVNGAHTVLLELLPHQQKTRADFYYTENILGVPIVCVSEISVIGDHLFYTQDGVTKKIDRIYNRVVFDELAKQSQPIQDKWNLLKQPLAIEWVTHPNHFFRISKYAIPLLHNDAIPATKYLHKAQPLPLDLENYVLKPLFSFAGKGVIIDVEQKDIDSISDPQNWILQQKVQYAPVITTPDGSAKAEIRLFYFWDALKEKYVATNNLTRLSKGKMIGVNYNQTATWVGGSLAYFEKD